MKLVIYKFYTKKYGPNVIRIRKYLQKIFTLHIRYKPQVGYMRVARGEEGHGPAKFLEYPVILCFKRQYLKQNIVARLKSNILTHPNFWAGHAKFHLGKIAFLLAKDE